MFGSFLFLIRECLLNIRRQGLPAIACVTTSAMALTVFGVFTLLAWQVHTLAQAIPRRFEVHAFARPSVPRQRVEALAQELRERPDVARVRLVTREQAWAEFRRSWPNPADLEGLGENPLPDKLEIAATSPEKSFAIAAAVRGRPEIARVNEGGEALRRLLAIAGVVRTVGILLAALLAAATAAVVGNAIRITLYARQREIRVMQLVGATNGFIRFPFVLEGLLVGAAGGLLAGGAVGAGLRYLTQRVLADLAFLAELRTTVEVPTVVAILALGGALLGLLGSLISLRRFLRPV